MASKKAIRKWSRAQARNGFQRRRPIVCSAHQSLDWATYQVLLRDAKHRDRPLRVAVALYKRNR